MPTPTNQPPAWANYANGYAAGWQAASAGAPLTPAVSKGPQYAAGYRAGFVGLARRANHTAQPITPAKAAAMAVPSPVQPACQLCCGAGPCPQCGTTTNVCTCGGYATIAHLFCAGCGVVPVAPFYVAYQQLLATPRAARGNPVCPACTTPFANCGCGGYGA